MNMEKSFKDKDISRFVIQSEGIQATISRLGGAIESLKNKGKDGEWREVCLHFDSPIERIKSDTYAGAVIGRVCNRIAEGKFPLNGRTYFLPRNDRKNTLHGGRDGFDKRLFNRERYEPHTLTLSLISSDGDQGFPGTLLLRVSYIAEGSSFTVRFSAVSDEDTVWAPTIHPYFRLDDEATIDETYLQIYANSYTPMDGRQIPTGEIVPVEGTPFDFRMPKKIGEEIGDEILKPTHGYDHNFVLRDGHAATAYSQKSGVKMDIYTDMPGLHFYSGNFLRGNTGTHTLSPREGFALEPQFFPNAVNIPNFVQPILRHGVEKTHFIRYDFGFVGN